MLEEILNKPEHIRKRVAYIATGLIGLTIITIWLIITSYNMKQALKPQPEETQAAENFRGSLPSLRQTQSVQTELSKKRATEESLSGARMNRLPKQPAEPLEGRSFLDKLLGK